MIKIVIRLKFSSRLPGQLETQVELENLFGILKETLTFQPPSDSYLEGEEIIGFEFVTHLLSSQFQISVHFDATVGINPTLSDPFTTRTSKLGWRYFEANRIDKYELKIHKKSQKGTGTKEG